MFHVSEKAGEKIQEFLKTVEGVYPIRLTLSEGGCSGGPMLGMALDVQRDGDVEFFEQGISFLMSSDLFERVKPVYVDFIETERGSGFIVSSALDSGCCCGTCN